MLPLSEYESNETASLLSSGERDWASPASSHADLHAPVQMLCDETVAKTHTVGAALFGPLFDKLAAHPIFRISKRADTLAVGIACHILLTGFEWLAYNAQRKLPEIILKLVVSGLSVMLVSVGVTTSSLPMLKELRMKGQFWLYVCGIVGLRALDLYHSVHSVHAHSHGGYYWMYVTALCVRAFTHNIMVYFVFITIDTMWGLRRYSLCVGMAACLGFEGSALISRRMDAASFHTRYKVLSLISTDAHGREHTIFSTFDAYNLLTILVLVLTARVLIKFTLSSDRATVISYAVPLSSLHPNDNSPAGAYNLAGRLLGERCGTAVAAFQRRFLLRLLALALAGIAANPVLEGLSANVFVRTAGVALVAASLFVAQAVLILCLRCTALRLIGRASFAWLWWSQVLVIAAAEVSIFSQRTKHTSLAFTMAFFGQAFGVSGSLAILPLLDAGTPDATRPLRVGGFLVATIYLFCNFLHLRLMIGKIHSEFTVHEFAIPFYGKLSVYNLYSVATLTLATLCASVCYHSIAHPDDAVMLQETVSLATLREQMHLETSLSMSADANADSCRRRVGGRNVRPVADLSMADVPLVQVVS